MLKIIETESGADPGIFDRGVREFTGKCEVEEYLFLGKGLGTGGGRMGGTPPQLGVFGGLPQIFQALKSAFWWILEMVLLWIMVKAKNNPHVL